MCTTWHRPARGGLLHLALRHRDDPRRGARRGLGQRAHGPWPVLGGVELPRLDVLFGGHDVKGRLRRPEPELAHALVHGALPVLGPLRLLRRCIVYPTKVLNIL